MTIETTNLGSVSEIVSVISKSENGSAALALASKLGIQKIALLPIGTSKGFYIKQ